MPSSGNTTPRSTKSVATYSVAGTRCSTSTGTATSAKSAVPSSNVTTTIGSVSPEADAASPSVSVTTRVCGREERHLLGEERRGQVDFDHGATSDPVVDQHDEAGCGALHHVDGGGRDLHRAASHAHHQQGYEVPGRAPPSPGRDPEGVWGA